MQILVPYAAHLAPEAIRGRVVGNVSSGLMLGIMLARPVSSFVTQALSWHAVFFISAALMIVLRRCCWTDAAEPQAGGALHYGELLLSMPHLARTTPLLQRRALYQASLFGAFSLFWTMAPLQLARRVRPLAGRHRAVRAGRRGRRVRGADRRTARRPRP